MATSPDSPPRPEKRRRLDRVTAACDLCKKRKTKCDGEKPCAYCTRKNRAATCTFSTFSAANAQVRSAGNTPRNIVRAPSDQTPPRRRSHDGIAEVGSSLSPTASRDDHQDDTVVPLEGRILRDAQGKVIFIGDCAPLSFLQTVRHLIASEVDPEGFSSHAVRDSIIEVAPTEAGNMQRPSFVRPTEIQDLVDEFAVATSGLVDLFQHDELVTNMRIWADRPSTSLGEAGAAVFYLVLAIGAQERYEARAEAWFRRARDHLVTHMCNSMNVSTVQGFVLVAIYMLRAFQPNGAYIYFCKYKLSLSKVAVALRSSIGCRTLSRIW